MSKQDRLKKLYELERLVATNGDHKEIEKLRMYVDGGRRSKNTFNLKRYHRMRERGMTLQQIADEFHLSLSGLKKIRHKHGLVKS